MENTLHQFDAADGSFPSLFKIQNRKIVDIKEDKVLASFKTLIEQIIKDQSVQIRELVKDVVIQSNWNLPIFPADEEEDAIAPEFLLEDDGEE